MALILRRPAVLMTAYVAVFSASVLWPVARATTHRNQDAVLIAVVLAVLAAHGSRVARVLMIIYSTLGVFVSISSSAHGWSPSWPRLWYMACCLLEIALLVSTPMYQRTRPGWAPGRWRPGPWLPAPRVWPFLASAAVGLGITLLHVGNLRPIPCPAHVKVLAHTPCLAVGYGWPFAYRWFSGYAQNLPNGLTRWLNIAAPPGLQLASFAADWAMWSVAILLVLYLIGLNSREDTGPPPRYAAEFSPAEP